MLCRVHGIRTQRYIPLPLQREKSKAKGDVIPSEEGMQSWRLNTVTADRSSYRKPHLAGERLYQSFFNRFDDGFRFGVYCQFVIDAVNM